MDLKEFEKNAHGVVDWIVRYLESVEEYPVKSLSQPGEIYNQLPQNPPSEGEDFSKIFKDFNRIIMPGITHWQSPSFFAYFPANSSPPSLLAEMLISALGAQCMNWETSPAAAELEERVLNWMRDMTGLPAEFEGVIQDSASTATLAAIITAREKITGFSVNENGFSGEEKLRAYCSTEAHSSVEKGIKVAGMGRKNLVRVAVKPDFSLDPEDLERAIVSDIREGYKPFIVVAALGTTSTTALDPIREIGEICRKYGIWLHVDAALAGTALVLPEFGWMIEGKEYMDSFVFNPHKWMFTNFDCTAYFVRDAASLIKTFEILPEYLKTRTRGVVNDYRDWGIPLGRRFRALKLWFVIRSYGVEGLREMIRSHISYASELAERIEQHPAFELMAPVPLNTVVFRFVGHGAHSREDLDALNEKIMHSLNDSGNLYMTHTRLNGIFCLRMVTAQTNVTLGHVLRAWEQVVETSLKLEAE
jgi:aromatic-L-amino-acid decarboxylase